MSTSVFGVCTPPLAGFGGVLGSGARPPLLGLGIGRLRRIVGVEDRLRVVGRGAPPSVSARLGRLVGCCLRRCLAQAAPPERPSVDSGTPTSGAAASRTLWLCSAAGRLRGADVVGRSEHQHPGRCRDADDSAPGSRPALSALARPRRVLPAAGVSNSEPGRRSSPRPARVPRAPGCRRVTGGRRGGLGCGGAVEERAAGDVGASRLRAAGRARPPARRLRLRCAGGMSKSEPPVDGSAGLSGRACRTATAGGRGGRRRGRGVEQRPGGRCRGFGGGGVEERRAARGLWRRSRVRGLGDRVLGDGSRRRLGSALVATWRWPRRSPVAAAPYGAPCSADGARGRRVADSPFTDASSICATSRTSTSSRALPAACSAVSPSASITRQNGQPTAIWSAPVPTASLVRLTLMRSPMFSSIHMRAPPAPQQKDFSELRSISLYSAPGRIASSSRGGE